jgi:Flp pilus assembly protein protease CpaA
MNIVSILLFTTCIAASIMVSICDYRYRKIPNSILGISFTCAVLLYVSLLFYMPIVMVLKGFAFGVVGMLVGGALLYVPYKYQQMGAGDVKLLMVYGFILGPKGVFLALLNAAVVGGLWALVLAWKHGGLSYVWYNIKFMVRSLWLSGGKEIGWDLRSVNVITMPYGVALAFGAITICIWQIAIHVIART